MLELIFSLVFGYVTAKVFAGPKDYVKGVLNSWIMQYHNFKIHVHHWISALFLMAIYVGFKLILLHVSFNAFDISIIYFLIGIIIQGIVDYKDWKEVIVND